MDMAAGPIEYRPSMAFLCHVVLVTLIPLLRFLVSALLLMLSLRQYLEQMGGHSPGSAVPAPRLTMALQSLAAFLVFYTSYFLSFLTGAVKITTFQNHWPGPGKR